MTTQVNIVEERQQWQLLAEQAAVLIKSKALPSHITTPEQAMAIFQTGRELGFPPMTSSMNISMVNGKPTFSANFIGALLKRAGYTYKLTKYADDEVVITFTYPDGDKVNINYTMEEARTAGNASKDNYKKYSKEMLYARCLARGGRIVAPEVLAGIYSPDEFEQELTPQEVAQNRKERVAKAIEAMKAAQSTPEALAVYKEYIDVADDKGFSEAGAAKKKELQKAKAPKSDTPAAPEAETEEAEIVDTDRPATAEALEQMKEEETSEEPEQEAPPAEPTPLELVMQEIRTKGTMPERKLAQNILVTKSEEKLIDLMSGQAGKTSELLQKLAELKAEEIREGAKE